jgi:alkanesulfonate monooxygenase SsuD/methylene tetrahydromethanopterin reductase-like flavin-dependent oxidoreductase (luciferase family)
VNLGAVFIRDDPAEARRANAETMSRHAGATGWPNEMVGTPEQIAERLRPFLDIGFRHFIVGFPAPHDAETMERLATEVRALVES